jgi:HPt (histidine-containing phosphotransfer) domain-containing protein
MTAREGEPLFDREQALAFLDGSLDLLAEAGQETLVEVPRQEARVRAALEAGDIEATHRAAHALLGTLGLMGGARAARSADLLQQAAGARNLQAMARRADELYAVLGRYLAELRAVLDALPRG